MRLTALGVGFTMLLTSALMGLVFLSSGTGHDESIEEANRIVLAHQRPEDTEPAVDVFVTRVFA